MALTIFLLPSSVDSSGSDWTNVGGSSANESLTTDNDDTSYVKATSSSTHNTFGMDDLKREHFSITSVQVQMKFREVTRGGSCVVKVEILDSSGSVLKTDTTSRTAANVAYTAFAGTTHTTSNSSDAWTESDLDGLQLKLTCTLSSGDCRVSYLALRVIYEETVGNMLGLDDENVATIIGKNKSETRKISGR